MGRPIVPLLTALAVLTLPACAKPLPADISNFSCVEHLRMPKAPAIATSARVGGDVTVAVLIAPDGSAQKITTTAFSGRGLRDLFETAVQVALKYSAFSTSCNGKTVTLAFGFRLAGGSDDNPWVGLVTFVHPNRFDIFETLPIIDVSGSSTAPR